MNIIESITRWTARSLSLVSLGMLLMFLIGEAPNPASLEKREMLLFVFFPAGVMIGLILAWTREAIGGMVAVVSLAAFYAVHGFGAGAWPRGAAFLAFTAPAFLFLLAAHLGARRPG